MKSKHHAGGVELALQRQDGSQKAAGPDRASVRGPRGARTFFQTALALLSVRVSQRQRDVTLTLCPSSSPMTVWQANLYRGLPFIAIVSWLITASEISDVRPEKSRSKSGGSSFPFAISLFLQGGVGRSSLPPGGRRAPWRAPFSVDLVQVLELLVQNSQE